MLESAPKEADVPDTSESEDCSFEERIINKAAQICDDTVSKEDGPMLHKLIALTIIKRLSAWHQIVGEKGWEDDTDTASTWISDSGKLQAAMQILESVSLGNDEFTCPED